ncbi:zinc finger and AT-hook domain containing, partial [Homo sapiens]
NLWNFLAHTFIESAAERACWVLPGVQLRGQPHVRMLGLRARDRLDPTAVNILQQIIELGAETHDATALASVVAMAPGTVTVVKQVTEEEPSSNHTVMIQETVQQASVELAEQHHLVVSSDDVEGIETVTVYTQGGEASEFIVYVQEAMQPVEEQAVEQPAQEL